MTNNKSRAVGQHSRRSFLGYAGVGLGTVALGTLLASCARRPSSSGGTGTVKVVTAQEVTGATAALVEEFNARGGLQIDYQEGSPDMAVFYDSVRTQALGNALDADVIIGDCTWTAQMAQAGWVADLSDRLPDSERSRYVESGIESSMWEDKLYAVPWFAGAAFLFYRKDILDKYGFEPPKTWAEMYAQAEEVIAGGDVTEGFHFQGARFEGGVCNGLDVIWSAGGDVLDPDDPTKVIIDSPEAVEGMRQYRDFLASGISPESVTTALEQDSMDRFFGGHTLFMNNWTDLYTMVDDPEFSSLSREQVGVTSLPVSSEGLSSHSALGGWNMFVNANSDKQDEAWEVIQFLTDPESQRHQAINAAWLPSLTELHDDPEILEALPALEEGAKVIAESKSRPVSPYYSDMSLAMQDTFNDILVGKVTPEGGLAALQEQLSGIIADS